MARDRIVVGNSKPQKKHVDAVRRAYRRGRLSLFVGAGVSAPYGVPTWHDLVTGLLLDEAGKRFRDFYPHYQKALASWLTREFGFSLERLARVVRYNLEKGRGRSATMAEALRKRLYANLREPDPPNTTLVELVRLIQKDPKRIRRIVNFNFDDLLLMKLGEAGIDAYPRYARRSRASRGLEIVHPHGFVPRDGAATVKQQLVFTEDEYHRIAVEPFNWAANEIASALGNSVALFVGLSMSDPNLLRILDGVREPRRRHYLLRLDYTEERIDRRASAREIQRAAEHELDRLSPHLSSQERARWIKKDPVEVENAIRRALKQAHDYDRQLFKDLGVAVIWVENPNDLAQLIAGLHDGLPTRRARRT